jgi:hypothetical protein
MKIYRIKKKVVDGNIMYCVQKRIFFIFWSTIEQLESKDNAKSAVSEFREADYYSWVKNRKYS